jgi:electron transfer flavoprotein alpha subunit
MRRVLLLAEHDGKSLNPNVARCVSCAKALTAETIDVAVFARSGAELAAQAALLSGVDRVLVIESDANGAPLAAVIAPQLAALAATYSHVFGPSSTFGKDVMPRAAALLDVGQISDVMSVEGPYRYKRPIYAGNAIVTVEADPTKILVATVRTASYGACDTALQPAPIEAVRVEIDLPQHTRFGALAAAKKDRPDLQTAARVVSGGRGVGSTAGFDVVNELADALGAAVGASRAAVDAGFVANDLQVGQTGKIIAPDLYVALGISGAIQHLTGIKDAGTIVAINSDPDAPIFEVADLGLVGDLFAIVPALIEALQSSD